MAVEKNKDSVFSQVIQATLDDSHMSVQDVASQLHNYGHSVS